MEKTLRNFENSNSRERREKKASALGNHYTAISVLSVLPFSLVLPVYYRAITVNFYYK